MSAIPTNVYVSDAGGDDFLAACAAAGCCVTPDPVEPRQAIVTGSAQTLVELAHRFGMQIEGGLS